jgi:AcrR family transcriptional regulator
LWAVGCEPRGLEVTKVAEANAMASEKETQILDAAARVFAQYGFRKTNMGDILREAGVARATLYKYFGSKDEVFHAVLMREMGEIRDAVRGAVEGEATTAEKLRVAVITHTDAIRRKINVLRVSLDATSHIMSKWKGETEELTRRALELYAGILRGGIESGEIRGEDPMKIALLLLYMLKGLFLGVLSGYTGSERDEVMNGVLDVIMNGLRSREEAA